MRRENEAGKRGRGSREQEESNSPILRKRLQVEKREQEKLDIGEEGR